MTNRTSRPRPAPSETRTAISRARVAACVVIRFATFTHAMSSTIPTSMLSTSSGAP